MKLTCKYFFLVFALLNGAVFAQVTQVATGTPPFGSFGGGPFDSVNLGNLNVHFAVPVLHKAGRGLSFSYDLSYDSSIWSPVVVNNVTQWQPATNMGWIAGVSGTNIAGYLGFTLANQYTCFTENGAEVFINYWSAFVYHDPWGRIHPLSGTLVTANIMGLTQSAFANGGCPQYTPNWTISGVATDGSGLSYTINGTTQNRVTSATITPTGGSAITPTLGGPSGGGTITDRNGNQVTSDGTGKFYDTLSSTSPVLTVTGSGSPSSPLTFTYSSPSGNAAYTMSYLQYTVRTNFGVTSPSAIAEYGPLSKSLVSGVTLPDGSSYAFTYESTPGSCTPLSGTQPTCVTGRIASVTLPAGGQITYTYTGVNNGIEADGSTAGLTRQLNPGAQWQYSRTPGTTGKLWTTTVTDPNSNQTAINFSQDSATTNPSPNFFETQRVVNQLINGTQTPLVTVTRCYNAVYANCATATVSSPITQTDTYSQLPNLPMSGTRLSEVLYNNFGLVTDDKEYDYGVTTNAAPGTTKLIRETVTSYASLGNGISNKPASVTVKDWSSGTATTLASTTSTYDQGAPTATSGTPEHISITGSRGNLTTITTSSSSTATLSKTFTYYDTGTPNVATDINGAQTTFVYGTAAQGSSTVSCGNSFPTTINEPLSLSRSLLWNCTGGMTTKVTDENGNNVTSNYTDANFWRPSSVIDPISNQTNITYIGQTAVEASLQNFNGGLSSSDSLTTVDGFGRPVFTQRKQGPSATTYDTAETDYNNMGQPSRSTMPYTATASPTSPNLGAPATTATYDALGRVLTVTDANGGRVSYTYTNNDVLQTVTGGNQSFQKQFEYDGLGRLTSVCEISTTLSGIGTCGQTVAKTGYWTKYTYDALGRLLTVTQNAQATGNHQTRTFAYDMLDRMTSESNPETGNGGVNGTVTYIYDTVVGYSNPGNCGTSTSHGDLIMKVDAAGNGTCNNYDALHRIVSVAQSYNSSPNASVTPDKCFVYDSATVHGVAMTNAKLHMVEAYTVAQNAGCAAAKITDEGFSYSARGEITDVYELTPHSGSGVYYHTTASYWPTGALKTLGGIPGVPTLNYGGNGMTGLDGEGRVTQVTASSGTAPVTSVTYSPGSSTAPLGALTGVSFGSADSDTFTYDPNTGRLATYTFSVNGKIDTGTLSWNANGTLLQLSITDAIPGTSDTQNCTYLYDDLQRLSTANCGALWTQNFTYDAFGNITKTGSSAFMPGYSPTQNQFTSIPGVSVSYDKNGDLLTDNLNTYTWDAAGHSITVSTGSTTVTAIYDALGRMVENNAGGTNTEFVYGPTGMKLAKVNGNTLVNAFIALPGGATAIYNTTGLAYYRHSDWLGSSRLTSTSTRTLFSSSAYAPFGEQYAKSGTADASFTGQDSDTVSSLYDFMFRKHSPSQGRWISPDPAGLGAVDPATPQSWNRYAYVVNNPLALVDPFGLCDDGSAPDDNGNCQYDPCWPAICVTGTDPGAPTTGLPPGVDPGAGGLDGGNPGGGGNPGNPANNGSFTKAVLPEGPFTNMCHSGSVSFLAPASFDFSAVVAAGNSGGLSPFAANAAVGQGGTFDYQRSSNSAGDTIFYSGYTNVSNFGVGGYLYGAGFTQLGASTVANAFAFFKSSNAGDPNQALYRNGGYQAAASGGQISCSRFPWGP